MVDEGQEKKELIHEPVKGYRTAFYIVTALSVGYLAWIFIDSLLRMKP